MNQIIQMQLHKGFVPITKKSQQSLEEYGFKQLEEEAQMLSRSWIHFLRCAQQLPKVCSETHISCHATFSNYYLTIYPCLVLSRAMQQCMQQAGLGNRQQQQSSMAQHSLIYNPNSEERNSFENAGVVVEFPMNNFTITFQLDRQLQQQQLCQGHGQMRCTI